MPTPADDWPFSSKHAQSRQVCGDNRSTVHLCPVHQMQRRVEGTWKLDQTQEGAECNQSLGVNTCQQTHISHNTMVQLVPGCV